MSSLRTRKMSKPKPRSKPASKKLVEPLPVVTPPDWSKGCLAIEHPRVMPGWGCCACYKEIGAGIYNNIDRAQCKRCGHKRCSRG